MTLNIDWQVDSNAIIVSEKDLIFAWFFGEVDNARS
jgi:hypothetical protein